MTTSPTARIVLADTKPAAATVDALVVGLLPARGKRVEVVSPGLTAAVRDRLATAFTAIGATAKSGDVARVPGGAGIKATTVVGLGLGSLARQEDPEALRKAVGCAVRNLSGYRKIAFALNVRDDDALLHMASWAAIAMSLSASRSTDTR